MRIGCSRGWMRWMQFLVFWRDARSKVVRPRPHPRARITSPERPGGDEAGSARCSPSNAKLSVEDFMVSLDSGDDTRVRLVLPDGSRGSTTCWRSG